MGTGYRVWATGYTREHGPLRESPHDRISHHDNEAEAGSLSSRALVQPAHRISVANVVWREVDNLPTAGLEPRMSVLACHAV